MLRVVDPVLPAVVYPPPEAVVDADWSEADIGAKLTVGDLCRMFEEAEEASHQARQDAERDRDYHDNKQLTDDQKAALRERGQPEVIINRIKRKVDYLVGLEKQQRTMPRSLPRTPAHEQDATAATDALRYVAETEDYHSIRSAVWRNMLIEGAGCCAVTVIPKRAARSALEGSTALTPMGGQPQDYDVKIRYYSWDRFFADPHSSRLDFSDASYLGVVLWMDQVDAVALYGAENEEIIESTLSGGTYSDTYEDTPKWKVWADRKRKRVRIVQIWIKRGENWFFAEFTKGGILKAGPSPHVNPDDGTSQCELIAQSAYCDRENNRYGVVREMISPQDEINKRRSKGLHILNTAQVITEDGAVKDPDEARKQAVRPDGWIVVNSGMMDKFKFETRTDMAAGQFQLLKEAKDEIDMMGPNASMQGDTGDTASGRAIMASQQGGMIQMGDLLDSLRTFDKHVWDQTWMRCRQYWTAPKWVRITDDERNVRFAPLNGAFDQATGRVGPPIASLDVDIIIDDAPDTVAPALEQFNSLVELKKFDANNEIKFRTIIEAAPNLRNKDRLLEQMDKDAEQAMQGQQGPPPEMLAMQAQLQIEQERAAQALQIKQAEAQAQMELKREQALLDMQIARERAEQEIEIARMKALADVEIRRDAAQSRAAFAPQEREMQ